MSERNVVSFLCGIKENIPYVTYTNLETIHEHIWNWVRTARKSQSEINGPGSLKFELDELMADVRKLAVVSEVAVAETVAYQSM